MTQDTLVALALIALAGPSVAAILSLRLPRYALVLGSLISLAVALVLACAPPEMFPLHFAFITDFYLDALSVYFILLISLVAFVATWYVDRREIEVELGAQRNVKQFRAMFGAFHLTLLLVAMVNDLFVLWLVVELTTVTSVILLLYGSAPTAPEAAWKYLYVTIPGLILTFLATALIAHALPDGRTMQWSALVQVAAHLDPDTVRLAFVFVLLGFGAKAGLAPLHTWLPDVHGEAPSPVSALLSSILLKVALLAMLRWAIITNLALNDRTFTSSLFLAFGVLSLGVATLAILKRNRFKRVLAYHSLEHMGIIAFGMGIGSSLAVFGALLHALTHALTKALMFLTFGNIQQRYAKELAVQDATELGPSNTNTSRGLDEARIQGVLKAMPASGGLLALGGLSLVGSPPFSVFLSEFIIVWAAFTAIRDEQSALLTAGAVVLLVSITLIFGGLISHISKILLDVSPFESKRETWHQLWPLFLLLVLVVAFGLTIPRLGPLDMPELLRRSTCIILGDSTSCQ